MRAIDTMLLAVILFNGVVFGGLGGWAIATSRRTDSPQFTALGRLAALVCAALVLGAVHRLGVQAHRLGWLPEDLGGALLTDLQLAKSLLAALLAAMAFRVALGIRDSLERMQRVSTALTGPAAGRPAISLSRAGLTDRETEIASLIGDGCLKDEDIAERLHISPHTARTHVRNILRKSGLQSRRELLLIADLPLHEPADRRQQPRHNRASNR